MGTGSDTADNLLVLEGIRTRLGEFTLGPVSFDLPAGGYLVLLGPSGCGKTSLLRCICGLQAISGGRIALGGKTISSLPPERRRIGYLPQASELFPHLDVAGNIAFALRYSGLAAREHAARFRRLVELIQLDDLIARRVHNLSGGESRRVALARCLAAGPRLLLLDEPLSMLDPNTRAVMLSIIMRLHRETGVCAVHVTHDREEALALGGFCAIMQAGRVEQAGPTRDVFARPETRFAAEFLGAGNVLAARFASENGGRVARAGGHEWPLGEPAAPGPGHLLLRPENLTLRPRPGAPAIAGVVTRRADRGIYTEIRVETQTLGALTAHLPGGPANNPGVGDNIALYLDRPPLALRD